MAASKFISLSAATAPVVGSVGHVGHPLKTHTMQVEWTSNPSVVIVYLWGSMDGTNYSKLATFDRTGAALISGDIVSVDNALCTHLKAELVTLTGGTAPAVTAQISSH